MVALALEKPYSLIVGMGTTGYSLARYLHKKKKNFHFFDTRTEIKSRDEFTKSFPTAKQYCGEIGEQILDEADEVLLSPGVSRHEPGVARVIAAGKPVVGDIELFLREAGSPVVGITGSNGKSTVTTLVGMALSDAGYSVGVGGNIGKPALDLLDEQHNFFVLELSSFQLESTFSLNLYVACHLNLSRDHMDRYASVEAYAQAKKRIFAGARSVVYNADDSWTCPDSSSGRTFVFSEHLQADLNEASFWFDSSSGNLMQGNNALLHKNEMRIKGRHNILNALATLAIVHAADVPLTPCLQVLRSFAGLPHRCEVVHRENGVTFVNDSKATNVGSALAAIHGLADEYERIVLIAGGDGKGADFGDLGRCIDQYVAAVILLGRDAQTIAASIKAPIDIVFAEDMHDAVIRAADKASNASQANALVLLSPACASLDMFDNYEARGREFRDCVHRLVGEHNA